MSRTLDIFVDFPQKIEYLIKELELILVLKFELFSDGTDNWYEFRNSTITLTIGKHDFENDHDIKFEEYLKKFHTFVYIFCSLHILFYFLFYILFYSFHDCNASLTRRNNQAK